MSLSTSQRLILATATARADRAVLPMPDGLTVRGRARRLMLEGMIKRGLITEQPARDGELAWAHSDDEFGLEITLKGRALVGSTDQEPSSRDDQPPEPATPREGANARNLELDARSKARPAFRTKQALLIDLLRRPEGATITEIQASTGWQPHTARAAITGLKKQSLRVSSAMRGDRTRAYRVIPNTEQQREPRLGAPALAPSEVWSGAVLVDGRDSSLLHSLLRCSGGPRHRVLLKVDSVLSETSVSAGNDFHDPRRGDVSRVGPI